MTTSPVMGITDELVADLEFDLEVAETTHQLEASVSREALAALLAERAELLRDSDRLSWLIGEQCTITEQNGTTSPTVYRVNWPYYGCKQKEWYPSARAAIDAAMQSEAKP